MKDFVEVKDKFGIIKYKEIDPKENIAKAGVLYNLLHKTRADDMFININMNNDEEHNCLTSVDKYQQLLRYKKKKDEL